MKEDTAGYNSYSRVCPSQSRRQPVILSEDEMEKAKKENPEMFQEDGGNVIKYGSNKDNQFYYVCPKYWNLREDKFISEEDIKKNNLQSKIIAKNEKVVKNGKYIYKFYEDDNERYP